MSDFFQNKVAVVTGAGGTLCSVIAVDLAQKGAKVALIGRTREKLTPVAEKIRAAGGVCGIYTADVTDEARMAVIADEIRRDLGVCRILVNGAGGNQPGAMTKNTAFTEAELSPDCPEIGFFNMDMATFSSVLTVNTVGSAVPSRIFGRQMAQNGGGSVLNFASMNTYCPLTRVPAYAMAKAAIANFTQWLAAYLAPAGIRVNAIAPGFFVNERSIKFLGTPESGLTPRGQQVIGHTPSGRFGVAQDLLGCAEWLLDDEKASFVTGITVPVDGGFLTKSGV